jgi:hypothetical protein
MKAELAELEAQHEALLAALDGNDVAAIERASTALAGSLQALKGFDSWVADPDLKLAAERIGRLAEAAMMRVNVLGDRARRRADSLAAMRGQPIAATYGR